jgi:autophagy-related protein 18
MQSPSTPFSTSVPSAAPVTSSTQSAGDVILFDALSLSVTNIVQAHKTSLACVQLNSTGTLLATASDKGTVIRVFSVPNGDQVAQFRRGTYSARIFSIAFNPVSSLLAVSSDSETVHIFKLLSEQKEQPKTPAAQRAEAARRAARQNTGSGDEDDDNDSQVGRYSSTSGRGTYDAFIDNKRSQGAK